MSRDAYFDPSITMPQYLADRGRLSGHVLSMVDKEPERFGAWLRGVSDDRSSPAMDQGIYFNDRLLEPDEVSRRYAFLPSRAEFREPVMVPAIGTRGKTKGQPLKSKKVPRLDENGEPVMAPQDAEGTRLSMLRQTDYAKDFYRRFEENARREGLTVVTPEQQTTVGVMLAAVRLHPVASRLLQRGRPEVTIHWTCEETGEPLQARPDWLDEEPSAWPEFDLLEPMPTWVEVKTWSPKHGRLDTMDPAQVGRWCRDGWPRKSAMIHDGVRAVTGRPWRGAWIVVEAVDFEPRVSVVWDHAEMIGAFYTAGRDGIRERETRRPIVRGYIELIRIAQMLREENDFRPDCVRDAVPHWMLPGSMLYAMENEDEGPVLQGARKAEAAYG